jgi:hypothetical protein
MIRKIAAVVALSALSFTAEAQTGGSQAQPPAQASAELPAVSTLRPNGTILLIPGRELVIAWKMPDAPTEVSEGAAPPHGLPPIPHDPDVETWTAPIPTDKFKRAEPGQIVFSLWVEEGRGTILTATSGQQQPFFYMANLVLRREGRLVVRPTTICAVRPGTVGLETWPYAVEAIQIVGMGLIPADMCYDHEAKKGYRMGDQPPSLAPPAAPIPSADGAV